MGRPADFFVSYTSAGRTWAEWIAWQLEAEGYQVVVQAWDFTPGHDWAHEMQDTTATAKRVVVVLSPAYLGSAHGEAEWRGLYADDPSGERGLLLVVRVEQVKPPGLLKTRVYVDAARPSSAVRPHQPCLLLCRPDGCRAGSPASFEMVDRRLCH
jgi:hypothetical protein